MMKIYKNLIFNLMKIYKILINKYQIYKNQINLIYKMKINKIVS
jgi:hypothetical protein